MSLSTLFAVLLAMVAVCASRSCSLGRCAVSYEISSIEEEEEMALPHRWIERWLFHHTGSCNDLQLQQQQTHQSCASLHKSNTCPAKEISGKVNHLTCNYKLKNTDKISPCESEWCCPLIKKTTKFCWWSSLLPDKQQIQHSVTACRHGHFRTSSRREAIHLRGNIHKRLSSRTHKTSVLSWRVPYCGMLRYDTPAHQQEWADVTVLITYVVTLIVFRITWFNGTGGTTTKIW